MNLGNLLDFNGNGIIDPNETLAFDGLASAAFNVLTTGGFDIPADADQITVIPEPGTAMLVGVGLGALAWRRRPRAT